MKRVEINNPFPAIIYYSTNHTGKWLVFFHGTMNKNEPLAKVEGNASPPKLANQGYEFEYNILAPHGVSGTGFDYVLPQLIPFLQSEGCTDFVVTGLSLGAQISLNFLWENNFKSYVSKVPEHWEFVRNHLRGVIPVAGKGSGNPDYSKALNVDVIAFHGDKDKSVSWYESNKVVNNLNDLDKTPQRYIPDPTGRRTTIRPQAILRTIEDGDHASAWNNAYSKDAGNPYAQMFHSYLDKMFASDVVPTDNSAEKPITFVFNEETEIIFAIKDGQKWKSRHINEWNFI